jgi:hypothetical protein
VIESLEDGIVLISLLFKNTYIFGQSSTSHVLRQHLTQFVFAQSSSDNIVVMNSSYTYGQVHLGILKSRLITLAVTPGTDVVVVRVLC